MIIISYKFNWFIIVNAYNTNKLFGRVFNSYADAFKFLEYKIHGTIPDNETSKNQSNIRL